MNLDEKLIQYRREREISQEALAEQLGVSRQAISKWETGESMPELSNLLALCKIFGTTPNDFFGYEVPASTPAPEPIQQKKPVWLIVLLTVSLVLNIALCSAIGLYIYHAYDEQVNAVVQPQDIPSSFEFREIDYRIVDVDAKRNIIEITYRPAVTKEGYVYGVVVTENKYYPKTYTGELRADGLVHTEITVKRNSGSGSVTLFISSDGINITKSAYEYSFEDGATYSATMTETFE